MFSWNELGASRKSICTFWSNFWLNFQGLTQERVPPCLSIIKVLLYTSITGQSCRRAFENVALEMSECLSELFPYDMFSFGGLLFWEKKIVFALPFPPKKHISYFLYTIPDGRTFFVWQFFFFATFYVNKRYKYRQHRGMT